MDEEVIRAAFKSFNAQDAEGVLQWMCEDVDWANPLAGGRLKGRAALRTHWAVMWTSLSPEGHLMGVRVDEEGRTVVTVKQVLKQKNGLVLGEQMMEQVYTLRDGLIARMDFRKLE